MFPVLFELPNAWQLSGGALIGEIIVGVACGLAWLALHLRGKRDTVAATLNTVAILVGLHLGLSYAMGETRAITIYSFGVIVILGFLAGATYLTRQTDRLGLDRKTVFDWAFWMLVVGILGARVFYAMLNYSEFSGNQMKVFKIWEGGLVWYGGLVPGIFVAIWLMRKYKLPVLHMCDLGSAAVILALGISRWACLLAGDDYGRITDSWVGIRFYDERSLIPQALRGLPLHPTQLYMSINSLWLWFALEWIRRRSRYAGQAFAWMLIGYAVTRGLVIEPLRGDFVERNPGYHRYEVAKIEIDKPDGPAISLKRGAKVEGESGQVGWLLEDLDLTEGNAYGTVRAISDGPVKALENVIGQGFRGDPPPWSIRRVEGVPPRVAVRGDSNPRWYGSDLPVPPGYVSTSQWISIFVGLAGVAVLLICRRVNEPGFTVAAEAYGKAQADS